MLGFWVSGLTGFKVVVLGVQVGSGRGFGDRDLGRFGPGSLSFEDPWVGRGAATSTLKPLNP